MRLSCLALVVEQCGNLESFQWNMLLHRQIISNQMISEAAKHAYHPHMSTKLLDLFVCSLQFHMCRTVGFLGNLWRLKAQEDVVGSM